MVPKVDMNSKRGKRILRKTNSWHQATQQVTVFSTVNLIVRVIYPCYKHEKVDDSQSQ